MGNSYVHKYSTYRDGHVAVTMSLLSAFATVSCGDGSDNSTHGTAAAAAGRNTNCLDTRDTSLKQTTGGSAAFGGIPHTVIERGGTASLDTHAVPVAAGSATRCSSSLGGAWPLGGAPHIVGRGGAATAAVGGTSVAIGTEGGDTGGTPSAAGASTVAGTFGGVSPCGGASSTTLVCGSVNENERLACVRAAYQTAIDAPPQPDGAYHYEVVRSNPLASPSPGGFGIAVIDTGGYLSSTTIYRDRVLGHYTLVGDEFRAIVPELRIPAPMARLMADTLSVHQEYASSIDTVDLAAQCRRQYDKFLPSEYTHAHGDFSFNALAELNPSAYFLLFHLDGSFSTTTGEYEADESFERLACAIREPEGPSNLHAFYRKLGRSIADVITDARANGADIRFVNLSGGMTPADTVDMTRGACPDLQFTTEELNEVQLAYAEYLEQIAESNVVLVQSALYPSTEINEDNWQQWYSDCESIPNRIRVGYVFGPKRAPISERVDASMKDGLRCIDLLVGMGWTDFLTPTDHAFKMSSIGLGHGTSDLFWGTSIAAPIGLSIVAHYWQNGHALDDSRALAAAFRADSTGIPALRDMLEDHLFLNSRTDYVNNFYGR